MTVVGVARAALWVIGISVCAVAGAPAAGSAAQNDLPAGGPAVLHWHAPRAPQLENTGPWRAEPILVSGASAYRGGEFLYQDWIYDYEGVELRVVGVFATLVRPTRHARDIVAGLVENLGDLLMDTVVPLNVTIEDAALQGRATVQIDRHSKTADAYRRLADELLDRPGRLKGRAE